MSVHRLQHRTTGVSNPFGYPSFHSSASMKDRKVLSLLLCHSVDRHIWFLPTCSSLRLLHSRNYVFISYKNPPSF